MNLEALSIKIFLPKGNANGLRTAEMSNWSGKAIACSRAELNDLAAREEAGHPGVYILVGVDPESGDLAAYVGEAEEVGKRLKQHSGKDFWNQVIAFVSKDENLTKAHVKYLEGKLIDIGKEAGRGQMMNGQSSGSRLPEADQAEMDIFLDKILKLLPVLGTNLFTPASTEANKSQPRLVCKIKGLIAYGNRTENGFVVYKNSQAVKEHRPSSKYWRKKREELIKKQILVDDGDNYIFSRDHEFSSPSAAGASVRGGATNGLTAWRDNSGKKLKEIEAE